MVERAESSFSTVSEVVLPSFLYCDVICNISLMGLLVMGTNGATVIWSLVSAASMDAQRHS